MTEAAPSPHVHASAHAAPAAGHHAHHGHRAAQPVLTLAGVTLTLGERTILRNANFAVNQGEFIGVLGPNGAGKTTMMDVITGKTRPDHGKVFLGQTIDLTRMNEPEIAHAGIGRKFQKPTVFEQHPVWENLELAMKADKGWWTSLRARLDRSAQARIEETLGIIGLESEARRAAGELSHGQKQRLEIGMLLMQQPALLLLDEPAAGMTDDETMQLAELLNQLRGTCSMMVVEHDMEFVAALAGETGKVTVMAEGRVLAHGTLDNVKQNESVIESYLGR